MDELISNKYDAFNKSKECLYIQKYELQTKPAQISAIFFSLPLVQLKLKIIICGALKDMLSCISLLYECICL